MVVPLADLGSLATLSFRTPPINHPFVGQERTVLFVLQWIENGFSLIPPSLVQGQFLDILGNPGIWEVTRFQANLLLRPEVYEPYTHCILWAGHFGEGHTQPEGLEYPGRCTLNSKSVRRCFFACKC